jgi:hypothetical protein
MRNLMKVLVTGPEHSGTGLLKDIVKHLSGDKHEVFHRAMPHVDEHGCEIWWYPVHLEYDKILVIRKLRMDAYRLSAEKRGKSDGEERAMRAEKYLGWPEGYNLWYETLIDYPEFVIKRIAEYLEVPYVPYPGPINAI